MKTVKRNKNDFLHNDIQFFLDKINKTSKNKKYRLKVIQDTLRKIYNGVCCYCESRFEQGSTMNIEHFYPKLFINSSYNTPYDEYIDKFCNLHYSCPKCNQLKNDRSPDGEICYNKKYKKPKYLTGNDGFHIFSPNFVIKKIKNKNNDDFIFPKYNVEDNFGYITYNIFPVLRNNTNGTTRAKGTIKLFALNGGKKEERIFLKEERIRVFEKALHFSELIETKINNPNDICMDFIGYLFQELSNMMDDYAPYSTMIKKQFGEIYVNLYDKYERLKKS